MDKESDRWLDQSKEDLVTAKYLLEGDRYVAAAFFAQQAAEKSLKAVQMLKLKRFDRVHDLVLLAKTVGAPDYLLEVCTKISPYYTSTRYPDTKVDFSQKDIQQGIKRSEEVVRWSEEQIRSKKY